MKPEGGSVFGLQDHPLIKRFFSHKICLIWMEMVDLSLFFWIIPKKQRLFTYHYEYIQ
jgi:hypothetical protein